MIREIIFEEIPQGFMEARRGSKMLSCQHMPSCVLPESLYNIEIWGVRREKDEFNIQFSGLFLNCFAMLVTSVVEHNGDRRFPGRIPDLDKECPDLLRIHIDHGMGFNEVEVNRVNTTNDIESVAARTTPEIKRLLAPHMAEESPEGEMRSIHEVEFSLPFFCLIHNRLQVLDPLGLLVCIRFPGYRLEFTESVTQFMKQLTCITDTDFDTTRFLDDGHRLGRTFGNSLFKSCIYLVHMGSNFPRTACLSLDSQNRLNTFIVIFMNQFSYEIAAAAGNDTDACATQRGFRHFGEQSAAAFTNNHGGGLLNHFFEMDVILVRIFDGKQCYIYKIKIRQILIYQRRFAVFYLLATFCTLIFCFTYKR